MTATLPLSVEQSCTFNTTLQYTDSAGTPINLTGYTAQMVLKWSDGTTYTLSTSNGHITITPLTGTLVLTIPAGQTANFQTGSVAKYELRITIGSTVTSLLKGSFSVNLGVF